MFFEQYEHEPAIAVARFLKTYSGHPEWYEARQNELTKRGMKALAALEQGLTDREWLAGDAVGLADITLYAYTHVAHEGASSWASSRRPAPGSPASPPNRSMCLSIHELQRYVCEMRSDVHGDYRAKSIN